MTNVNNLIGITSNFGNFGISKSGAGQTQQTQKSASSQSTSENQYVECQFEEEQNEKKADIQQEMLMIQEEIKEKQEKNDMELSSLYEKLAQLQTELAALGG